MRKFIECSSLLANIRENLIKVYITKIAKWYERKIQESKPSRYSFYISLVKPEINTVSKNVLKKYAIRYFQLKGGYKAVEIYLAQIGKIETPEC